MSGPINRQQIMTGKAGLPQFVQAIGLSSGTPHVIILKADSVPRFLHWAKAIMEDGLPAAETPLKLYISDQDVANVVLYLDSETISSVAGNYRPSAEWHSPYESQPLTISPGQQLIGEFPGSSATAKYIGLAVYSR